ncbi:hypothetical protein BZA70DRAFT_273243 [Myxozyma melibiosi]|uniref:Uncharacterized protein n=1 Tax=Myxozyma melibiosi TaxID=54550 RepID=A0ABR1FEI3_9ASCO
MPRSINLRQPLSLLSLCLFSVFLVPVSAGSAFCKCTCFSNSTLVRMPDDAQPGCSDCTRKFCLDYNLPICKDASEDTDVNATCYQRDSAKDEAVVILFIIVAGGLIASALLKRAKARYFDRR